MLSKKGEGVTVVLMSCCVFVIFPFLPANQVTTRAAVVDRTISVSIPAPARGVAVRFRLWQPDHDDNNDAFEIDNVVIGGM